DGVVEEPVGGQVANDPLGLPPGDGHDGMEGTLARRLAHGQGQVVIRLVLFPVVGEGQLERVDGGSEVLDPGIRTGRGTGGGRGASMSGVPAGAGLAVPASARYGGTRPSLRSRPRGSGPCGRGPHGLEQISGRCSGIEPVEDLAIAIAWLFSQRRNRYTSLKS